MKHRENEPKAHLAFSQEFSAELDVKLFDVPKSCLGHIHLHQAKRAEILHACQQRAEQGQKPPRQGRKSFMRALAVAAPVAAGMLLVFLGTASWLNRSTEQRSNALMIAPARAYGGVDGGSQNDASYFMEESPALEVGEAYSAGQSRGQDIDPMAGILPVDFVLDETWEAEDCTAYTYIDSDGTMLNVAFWKDLVDQGDTLQGEVMPIYDVEANFFQEGDVSRLSWPNGQGATVLILTDGDPNNAKEDLLEWATALQLRLMEGE